MRSRLREVSDSGTTIGTPCLVEKRQMPNNTHAGARYRWAVEMQKSVIRSDPDNRQPALNSNRSPSMSHASAAAGGGAELDIPILYTARSP